MSPDPVAHVVLLDGTLASLEAGRESSIGLACRLIADSGAARVYYEPGIQWRGWRRAPEVMAGVGINRQIRRAYAHLSAAWRPGDRVYLMGYSRGAYAVRALAGMIDRMGLLRPDRVGGAAVRHAYQHYRIGPTRPAARRFSDARCDRRVVIDAVGVLDTVQAVGIRWPVLWRLFPEVHVFRSHRLGPAVRHGFHALAADEARVAFRPEMWRTHGQRTESVEQMWFRGRHADVGGQIGPCAASRPLANLPLVWLLERMESVGLPLPDGWRDGLPVDAEAPRVGAWRGFGPLFLARRRRQIGADASERVHPSATVQALRSARSPLFPRRHAPVMEAAPSLPGEGARPHT